MASFLVNNFGNVLTNVGKENKNSSRSQKTMSGLWITGWPANIDTEILGMTSRSGKYVTVK